MPAKKKYDLCKCQKRKNFGYPGQVATCCKQCKDDNMIDVRHPVCSCGKRANFGLPNGKRTHCSKCRTSEMKMFTQYQKCICKKSYPVYGFPGNKAERCKLCKLPGMEDLKSAKCQCGARRPSFGYRPGNKAICCKNCKQDGMVDVVTPKCICGKHKPHFGYVGLKSIACNSCKSDGMINLNQKKCKCGKSATFGLATTRERLCCKDCKTAEMIDVCHPSCPCGSRPTFGIAGSSPSCCKNCKSTEMVDIVNNRCALTGCETIVSHKKYDGYCLRCFVSVFPDAPTTRNIKAKEKLVKDHFQSMLTNYPILSGKEILYDQSVGGCSKRRPDISIDMLSHVIICECDEFQHRNHEAICETKRMMELYEDFGFRPIVFIRFNPDSYVDRHGLRFGSCFRYHRSLEIPIICRKDDWFGRLETLQNRILHHACHVPNKAIISEYLFYDYVRS